MLYNIDTMVVCYQIGTFVSMTKKPMRLYEAATGFYNKTRGDRRSPLVKEVKCRRCIQVLAILPVNHARLNRLYKSITKFS